MSRARIALVGLAGVLVVIVIVVAVGGSSRRVPAVRLEYSFETDRDDRVAALDRAVEVIRSRLDRAGHGRSFDAVAVKKDWMIVVVLGDADRQLYDEITVMLGRPAKLELLRVDPDAEFFRTIHVQTKLVAPPGIDAVTETWPTTGDGTRLAGEDRFLRASDRAMLERHVATLAADNSVNKPTPDRQIAYELARAPGGKTASWRTHVLEREPWLTGAAIHGARVTIDDSSQRPQVLVDLEPEAGRRFGELTRMNVGHKVAIVLDGVVHSAPLIQGPILGGQLVITMGYSDDPMTERTEAEQLAAILGSGALPGTLDLLTTKRFETAEESIRWWLLAPLGLAAVALAMVAMVRFGRR